jgi:hypothetical protein
MLQCVLRWRERVAERHFKMFRGVIYVLNRKHPLSSGFPVLLHCHGRLREESSGAAWSQGLTGSCCRPYRLQRHATVRKTNLRSFRGVSRHRPGKTRLLSGARVPRGAMPKNPGFRGRSDRVRAGCERGQIRSHRHAHALRHLPTDAAWLNNSQGN